MRTIAPLVCIEGPSAVGKTRLTTALARAGGAARVPEVTGTPPAGADPAAWFVARHVEAYAQARELAATAQLVVLDGDPFKGLWYHWIFAADVASSLARAAQAYARSVTRGDLAFPDLYVVLGATEAQLRDRRAGDPTRSRRNFESHLRLVEPQRRYYGALASVAPGRVLWLDTSDGDSLAGAVLDAVAALPPTPRDAKRLLRVMTAWVDSHPPRDATFPFPG